MTTLFLQSCEKKSIPPELEGTWKTGKHEITVRTVSDKKGFQFVTDTAAVKLIIDCENVATGLIGSATFENARVKINGGNPDITGVAYKVECGSIGKIFERDPLDSKEVEIWLGPLKGNTIDAELRYTEGWAYFPMAQLIFTRE
ncbi:MAG: hypothetical protein A2V64_12390 [Bacteroidetes bacterium RBG_13_43_22]|nr:MAG: hypothetical protein A2V64_12390 [Bacteroidetes bacterium RBG_13_43_22]